MFCSTCGNTLNPGLRFCNKCGAKTGVAKEQVPGQLPESTINFLIAAMLGLPIAGVALLIGLAVVLKTSLGFAEEWVVISILFCVVMFLAAEAGFLWLLFSRTRVIKGSTKNTSHDQPAAISEARTSALGEAGVDLSDNIGESTTRILDTVPRDRPE
jgi:hypothetical protein